MKWKPEENELFYVIVSTMMQSFDVIRIKYENKAYRLNMHIRNNNCFRTKKEAQAKLRLIKQILRG